MFFFFNYVINNNSVSVSTLHKTFFFKKSNTPFCYSELFLNGINVDLFPAIVTYLQPSVLEVPNVLRLGVLTAAALGALRVDTSGFPECYSLDVSCTDVVALLRFGVSSCPWVCSSGRVNLTAAGILEKKKKREALKRHTICQKGLDVRLELCL